MPQALPPELLSHISAHVKSRTTLNSLMLCSKQLYNIVAPHLYSNLELEHSFTDRAYAKHDVFPLRHLTSLFLQKPKLAQHVRYLSIRPFLSSGPRNLECISIEEAQALPIRPEIRSAIKALSLTEQEEADWLRDFHANNEDAVFSLFLATLPNLETIDLEFWLDSKYFERTLTRAARKEQPFDKSPVLARLSQACWFHSVPEYGGSLVAGLFELPSLRSLFLHRIGNEDFPDEHILADLQSKSSSIEHLELHDCRLNDIDLRDILRVPRSLKTFIYLIGVTLSYCGISLTVLHEALQQHKATLEDVWLDKPEIGHEAVESSDEPIAFQSLRDFVKLRRLRIATTFVFGPEFGPEWDEGKKEHLFELLPVNLEVLHLTRCQDILESDLCEALTFLLQHAGELQHLSRIVLEEGFEEPSAALVEVLRLSDRTAVSITIVNTSGDWWSEERKWGMDGDIEWKACTSGCNKRPTYEVMDLQY